MQQANVAIGALREHVRYGLSTAQCLKCEHIHLLRNRCAHLVTNSGSESETVPRMGTRYLFAADPRLTPSTSLCSTSIFRSRLAKSNLNICNNEDEMEKKMR